MLWRWLRQQQQQQAADTGRFSLALSGRLGWGLPSQAQLAMLGPIGLGVTKQGAIDHV